MWNSSDCRSLQALITRSIQLMAIFFVHKIGDHDNFVRKYNKQREFVSSFVATTTGKYSKYQRDLLIQKWLKFNSPRESDPRLMTISSIYILFVLLMRRGYLKHYQTLVQLISNTRRKIFILPIIANHPMSCKAAASRKSLVLEEPAVSESSSPYQSRAVLIYGCPDGATFYC
jgi:hypothetical protein